MRELHLSDNYIRTSGFYYMLAAVANSDVYPIVSNVWDASKADKVKDKIECYSLWIRVNNNYVAPREAIYVNVEDWIELEVHQSRGKNLYTKIRGSDNEKFLKTAINRVLELKQSEQTSEVKFKPLEQTGDWKKDQKDMTKKCIKYNTSLSQAKT